MKRTIHYHAAMAWLIAITAIACRNEDLVVYPTTEEIPSEAASGDYAGLYILNEGNMGSNKATLDYLDFSSGTYSRNIYPSRNPNPVMELGDVGNDLKIYGSRLWMVVNCSNKVEVADAWTTVSRGHIDIPNCRNMAFHRNYAYVSSYVGTMQESSMLGQVYKIDTLTLKVAGQLTVGRQPEEMAVLDGKLYVANSGGYSGARGQGYDRTVSVIDLETFQVDYTIDVAPNLFRLRSDSHGQLWVTSRGDYGDTPAKLYVLGMGKKGQMVKTDSLTMAVGDLSIVGDSLYYYTADLENPQRGATTYGIIHTVSHQVINGQALNIPTGQPVPSTPYGIIVHPQTREVYLMDATNFVSSGRLFCFDKSGEEKWVTWTGDIPGHAVFLPKGKSSVVPDDAGPNDNADAFSPYIEAVDEYVPAPGQFVNVLPAYEEGDDAAAMVRKCTEAIAHGHDGLITLGAYGGYVTFHFDHPIANVAGQPDIYIKGNAIVGNSEPGIVMVSQDTNGNGLPDDAWYELAGSVDDEDAASLLFNYEITYTASPMADIPWEDNQSGCGIVARNKYHQQEYFPLWLPSPLTFKGTLLPQNGSDEGSEGSAYWVLRAFSYGYADNQPTEEGSHFDIGRAVDNQRQTVSLSHIDFVRVYTAVNQHCGWLGETSTEISGAADLHLEKSVRRWKSRP